MPNKIAIAKNKEVMDYLHNGLRDQLDTIGARHEQQKGLEVFRKTDRMLTPEIMQELQFQRIYNNCGFGMRSRFNEMARVCLTSVARDD